jgi:peroxiredoxin
VTAFSVPDTVGKNRTQAEWAEAKSKAVVLIFLGLECPVSNGYAPEMARLAAAWADKGVTVWGVHPDPDVTAEAAAKHAAEYGLKFPVVLDAKHALVSATGAATTPEAVVLVPGGTDGKGWTVAYRGRIDDRYTEGGKRREVVRSRDLADAVEAVLSGKAPAAASAPPFGCPIPKPAK